MKTEEIRITGNEFEWMGVRYDISLCIERDIELIKQEAERTHGGVLDVLYVRESLCPTRVRLFLDGDGKPSYMMVIYEISYRNGNCFRRVCGDYYPIGKGTIVYPHPYQASICW